MSVLSIRHQPPPSLPRNFGGFSFAHKKAEIHPLPSNLERYLPLVSFCIPQDSAMRGRPISSRDVLTVLVSFQNPKVTPSVVQSVSVDVVCLPLVSMREPEHSTVHLDGYPARPLITAGIAIAAPIPPPLVDPVGISGVDQRIRSNAAISGAERNQDSILMRPRVTPRCQPPAVDAARGHLLPPNYTSSLRAGG